MLSLLRSRRALAGVEFAMILPFMVALLLGTVDISRAYLMSRRLTIAAEAVATIASTEAVQIASLSILTATQALAATTAPFAIFPTWLPSPLTLNNSFSITLSEINFKPTPSTCTSNCSYSANVFWSVGNPNGQARLRTCGTLSSVLNGTASSLTTLPAGNFGQTSLFVADVSQIYTPIFTSVFTGSFVMTRTAYVSPRVQNSVTLPAGFLGPFVLCPLAAL